jgi:hypothetical protein
LKVDEMGRQRWIALIAAALLLVGSLAIATGAVGRALPVWNPGYNGQLPPATDPAYKGQDAIDKQGPDTVCSDTNMSNPADEPVCPTPKGAPVTDPSSDTTTDGSP